MKTSLITILITMLIAAGLALASPVEAAKPLTAGLPLPTVTLAKAGSVGYGPTSGCSGGQRRPRMSLPSIRTEGAMQCLDSDGYKIVSMRVARRLYARRTSRHSWHVYSDAGTVRSRMWEGPVSVNVEDHCNYGDGWYWFQVRMAVRVQWSYPATHQTGTADVHRQIQSDQPLNCGYEE